MRPIRIASLNAYLICDVFNNYRRTHPEQRASKIRRAFLSSPPPVSATVSASLSASSNSGSNSNSIPDTNTKTNTNTKTSRDSSRLALDLDLDLDLCFFQEVWGSGIRQLTDNIQHAVPPRRSPLLPSEWWWAPTPNTNTNTGSRWWGNSNSALLEELADTLRFHRQRTGGLYDASHPSMTCAHRRKHTFGVSRSRSHKGVEATLWDVPQWDRDCDCYDTERLGTGGGESTSNNSRSGSSSRSRSRSRCKHRQLLVFNTHLDPWHPANRKQQIAELLGFMEDTMRSIEIENADAEARARADGAFSFFNPSLFTRVNTWFLLRDNDEDSRSQTQTRHEHEHEYDWSQTAVLVVGDFNIKAGSKEYREALPCSSESVPSGDAASIGPTSPCRGWIDYFAAADDDDNGDGDNHPEQHTYAIQNSLVAYPEDCGRIDYIFGIPRFDTNDRIATVTTTETETEMSQRDSANPGPEQGQRQPKPRVFLPLTVVSRSIRTEPIGDESSDHYALILGLMPSV